MKKSLSAMMTAILVVLFIFQFAGAAFAAEAPQEMVEAVDAAKQEALHDYDKGSLKLYDFQEISVNDPELDTGTVQMALAEYKTVRDKIFYIHHREVVYYDPENGQVLQEAQLANVPGALEFKEAYEGTLGAKLQLGTITVLVLIVPIVYILLLMYVWEPRQYSTTKFKIKNKLYYGQQQTFN